jgi:small subunit ribosomal protein S16
MAVVIRMKRVGRRNRPCYRISVADRALPRDGRTLEMLGVYDPASPIPDLRLRLDVERARHWVTRGAQPSNTVYSILKREGVYEGLPVAKPRKRTGRGKSTATKTRRDERKKKTAELKSTRRSERVAARRAAAKQAAAEAAAEAAASEES